MSNEDVRVLVLVAAGTNCDRETGRAFREAGAAAERVHVRELIDDPSVLSSYQILAIPGGFSYGDDLGAGKIFANEIRFLLGDAMRSFVDEGGLVLGICNGFQVLVQAGLLPALDGERQEVTLADNDSGRFECRWTYLDVAESNSAFVSDDMDELFLPVAHAEGKLVVASGEEPGEANEERGGNEQGTSVLSRLETNQQIVFRYSAPGDAAPEYPWNPNGSVDDIAALSDSTGRIMGMMPHPERFYQTVQHPSWTRGGSTGQPDGLRLIRNGVQAARRLSS